MPMKQKTKYMIAAGKRTILDAGRTAAFGDKNFKVLNEFVYLKALVTPKNDVGLEIQKESKLQIFSSAIISPGMTDKVNDLQDLDPPGPAVRQ
jgi:hypothetical protein